MKYIFLKLFSINLVDIVRTKRDKSVLVFVNPAGGAGKAQRLVREYVVGVWSEAEFNYQLIVTGFKQRKNKRNIYFLYHRICWSCS
jgi:hypothetical protein